MQMNDQTRRDIVEEEFEFPYLIPVTSGKVVFIIKLYFASLDHL